MAYLGPTPSLVQFSRDSFSGTGSQTVYTLTFNPGGASGILVYVNGVFQVPTTNYTVTGTTLTFTSAPAGSAVIAVVYLGQVGTVNTPATGTVSYATLASSVTTSLTSGKNRFVNPSIDIDQANEGVSVSLPATTGQLALRASVAAGGTSGFLVGDTLTVTGGTRTTAATFTVTAVSAGVVTQVKLATAGSNYTVIPTNPATMSGGSGTGTVTLNVVYGNFQYIVDQWQVGGTTNAAAMAAIRVADAPQGFLNSLKVTVSTTSATVATGDSFTIVQNIEGFNIADLNYGTANAQTISVSFWVKTSIASNTFGFALQNGARARSYATTFTTGTASTWTQITIANIPGDTAGTWLTDLNAGLTAIITLEAGSNLLNSTSGWQATTSPGIIGVTGSQHNFTTDANNSTFQVTGLQLEVGTVVTNFDRRPYPLELMLCQRYYEKTYDSGTALGALTQNGCSLHINEVQTATTDWASVPYKVTKRNSPTITVYSPNNGAAGSVFNAGLTTNITGATSTNIGEGSYTINYTIGATNNRVFWHWVADARV